jgi:LysM repeat protein
MRDILLMIQRLRCLYTKHLGCWLLVVSSFGFGLAGCQIAIMPSADMAAAEGALAPVIAQTTPAVTVTFSPTGPSIVPTAAAVITPVLTVTLMMQSEPVVLPTPTPQAALASPTPATTPAATLTYTVASGDSLFAIALSYGITVDDLRAANGLTDSLIHPDQVLLIPAGSTLVLAPTTLAEDRAATPSAAPDSPLGLAENGVEASQPYIFSPLYSDLTAGYPASIARERFTLHYAPNRPPVGDLEAIADLVQRALDHHEQLLGVTLPGRFDIFAAGTLFAPPDQLLRGRAFSRDWRTVFLFDGSGNAADQQYLVAHELTHLFVWNTFGAPVSVMLSEGVAVYTGMEMIGGSDHMPIRHFCSAYLQADVLPRISQPLDYLGHIRNLENYYAAGCFVQYLIEQYGAAAFGQLYPSGDFVAVYGKTVETLEAEWIDELIAAPLALPFAPADLVAAVTDLEVAYRALFADFSGSPDQLAAYWALDAKRVALLEGRLGPAQQDIDP